MSRKLDELEEWLARVSSIAWVWHLKYLSANDTLYLFDAVDGIQNHTTTMVYGYISAGNSLAPIIEQLTLRRVECRTLAALRDVLLPKLISGELRVKDAQQIVGEH